MSTNKRQLSTGPQNTKKIAKEMTRDILKKGLQKQAVVLALTGELGSGKTTFIQGLARGLGLEEKITSPTFVIMKSYQLPSRNIKISKYHWLYHIDCYRLEKPKEILDLGFKQIISEPKNIIAIEWADKIKTILPSNTLWLKFTFKNKTQRQIKRK